MPRICRGVPAKRICIWDKIELKSFRKKILEQKSLIDGIKSRGYSLSQFSTKISQICCFDKTGKDGLVYSITLSPWVDDEYQCGLSVNSLYLTNKFHELDLFFDVNIPPPSSKPKAVLSIDLVWLRCNDVEGRNTDSAEYKMNSEVDTKLFFEDLDTYGDQFLNDLATPDAVADFLLNLKSYPRRIKMGGGPGSADPYVNAAILYLQNNAEESCLRALDLGLAEYNVVEPIGYQVHVLDKFKEKRRRILTSLQKT